MSAWLPPVSDATKAVLAPASGCLLLEGDHRGCDHGTGNADGRGPEPPLSVDRIVDGLLLFLAQILHAIRDRRAVVRDDGRILENTAFLFVFSPSRLDD